MATHVKLEIIKECGEISFYEIEPHREVINFGTHPDNDIVVSGANISPFHAMLDLRHRPFRFVKLGDTVETGNGDQVISPSEAREIHPWDTIELGDCRITLIESEGTEKHPAEHALIKSEGQALAKPGVTGQPPPYGLSVRPSDQLDDAIVTEPVVPEFTIDAGQTLTLSFHITNRGETAADFEVSLQGLNPEWVAISPANMNLNVNQRASVNVHITPPRAPSSLAGPHHFAVTVTSPTYAGHMSRRGATLIINPYYEFTTGDLTPRQLSVSWNRRTAAASLALKNQGNSRAGFRVQGNDEENACGFEFQSPGENVRLANQVDFSLAPDASAVLPVFITSRKRQLIGLRSRDLQFTVTTAPLEGAQPSRTLMGQLYARPLVGPWLLLASLVAFFIFLVFVFWPRLGLTVSPTDISAGQAVDVRWTSWPPLFMTLRLNGQPLSDSHGEITEHPLETTQYQLSGDTWASRLFAPNRLFSLERTVNVSPVTPEILRFQAAPPQVEVGSYTEISWSVVGANRLVLISDVFSQTLDTLEGSQKIRLEQQTAFTLKAYSDSLPGKVIEQVLDVAVLPPPGKPAPIIQDFRVEPATITAGQSVSVTWRVSGAEQVSINPIGDALPTSGAVGYMPAQTVLFVLSASNGDQTTSALRQVTVNNPTPTPTATPQPLAPVIELFTVAPAQPVQVSNEDVSIRLDWVVSGASTNITLTGGPLGNAGLSQLNPQDSLSLTINDDAVFVLRAINGDQQTLRTLEVRLLHTNIASSIPPPPYNLSGLITSNPSPPPDNVTLLTWAYNSANAIIGFRLYRNDGSGFSMIADESQLNNVVPQYFDTTAGNCMTYYVVAVYQNSANQRIETAPSNQWASACP